MTFFHRTPIAPARLAAFRCPCYAAAVPFLKILAVLAVVGSATSAIFGTMIAINPGKGGGDPKAAAARRRLYSSIHISSGILLSVVSALLAFWAFTE